MSLLAIIISLLLERYFEGVQAIKYYAWFDRFGTWGAGFFKNRILLDGPLGVVIILVPFVVITGLIEHGLNGVSAVLSVVFAIVVLIYCLGPGRLRAQATAYINCRNNDDQDGVRAVAAEILEDPLPEAAEELDKAVVEAVLAQTNERVLAPIFWFFVLGPIGAVAYRFTARLVTDAAAAGGLGEGLTDAAMRLRGILDWLPARITAWGYALMGDFSGARRNWQIRAFEWIDNWVSGNRGVLVASGTGALRINADLSGGDVQGAAGLYDLESIKGALDLAGRTTAAWLVAIALLTLAGWSLA